MWMKFKRYGCDSPCVINFDNVCRYEPYMGVTMIYTADSRSIPVDISYIDLIETMSDWLRVENTLGSNEFFNAKTGDEC